MSDLLIALGAGALAVGFVAAYRYGLPVTWRPGDPTPPIEYKDDHESGGFKTDFGPRREQPPTDADGPGWDS